MLSFIKGSTCLFTFYRIKVIQGVTKRFLNVPESTFVSSWKFISKYPKSIKKVKVPTGGVGPSVVNLKMKIPKGMEFKQMRFVKPIIINIQEDRSMILLNKINKNI